ncbi:uncharacterized protein LOC106160245 [Lingula anatina]|nr:uncharacterized protein LOC106160245 [Lingula anatina]|eukprot:XP_013392242.1 uncharacterized protein LOC106160245 [Lingula anatina]
MAVRDGYGDGLKRGLKWTFDQQKPHDAENHPMTEHIITFVRGWAGNAEASEEVVKCAIKRYFITKKQEDGLKKQNQLEVQRQKRVKYERKKEKAKRRMKALQILSAQGWQSEVRRAQIRSAIEIKYTSSDEECDDGFITHPPSWQSDKFAQVKRALDRCFVDNCSHKSRRLLQNRKIGAVHVKSAPNCPEDVSWIVKKD